MSNILFIDSGPLIPCDGPCRYLSIGASAVIISDAADLGSEQA